MLLSGSLLWHAAALIAIGRQIRNVWSSSYYVAVANTCISQASWAVGSFGDRVSCRCTDMFPFSRSSTVIVSSNAEGGDFADSFSCFSLQQCQSSSCKAMTGRYCASAPESAASGAQNPGRAVDWAKGGSRLCRGGPDALFPVRRDATRSATQRSVTVAASLRALSGRRSAASVSVEGISSEDVLGRMC